MKAIVMNAYGGPEVLELKEVEKPEPADGDLLVKVHAAGLNAGDYFSMRGSPWLARMTVGFPKPKDHILGWDLAGEVEAVGKDVTRFKPGDKVFACVSHTLAEYALAPEDEAALVPGNLPLEETAAVPTAGVTALHALRDRAKVQPGQQVLVNGASGGVGTFAVQVAKALGAEVTGVCSTRNVDMVKSLGAKYVIDYTKEDFAKTGAKYDLILDNVGNRSFADCRRALTPAGLHLPNTGHGGMSYVIKAYLLSAVMRRHASPFMSVSTAADLQYLKGLVEAGKLTPVVDRTYPLEEAADALRYLEEEHARGKVVVTMQSGGRAASSGRKRPHVIGFRRQKYGAGARLGQRAPGMEQHIMRRRMLGGKIHRATVTGADLDYEGSVTIDADLLEAAGMLDHEAVEIWDITNGARLTTYVMTGPRGSGEVCINGAAAHLIKVGDLVIIANFVDIEDKEARTWEPRVVFVDAKNKPVELRQERLPASETA